MAGLGRKVWTRETLTSGDLQGYLQDQVVMRFASASARDAAIPAPSEGMCCYLDDTDQMWKYAAGVYGWIPLGVGYLETAADRPANPRIGSTYFENDLNRLVTHAGAGGSGGWRSIGEVYGAGAGPGNSLTNLAWAGTSYAWVAGLGAKVTVPADGTNRRIVGSASFSITGDMWARLRVDRAGGTTTYHPNTTGMRYIQPASTEGRHEHEFDISLDGTQVGTIYLEAKAQAAASGSINVPMWLGITV